MGQCCNTNVEPTRPEVAHRDDAKAALRRWRAKNRRSRLFEPVVYVRFLECPVGARAPATYHLRYGCSGAEQPVTLGLAANQKRVLCVTCQNGETVQP